MRPHRHIVQLLGVCIRPAAPLAIVLDFMEGGSLRSIFVFFLFFFESFSDICCTSDVLKDKTIQFDYFWALKMALQTAAGMHHLICEGIVHRYEVYYIFLRFAFYYFFSSPP